MKSLLRFLSVPPGLIAAVALAVLFVGSLLVWNGFGIFGMEGTEPGKEARVMAVVLSLVAFGCALYIILSDRYDEATEKWAYGIAGSVLGYWIPAST